MNEHSHSEHHQVPHISDFLLAMDKILIDLHNEAGDKLLAGDLFGYEANQAEQTRTIAGMADELEKLKENGMHVPDEVQALISTHSQEAQRAIEDGVEYTIVAFYIQNLQMSPTILGQLAVRFMPPNEP